jgi:hypothetical protein
MRSIRAADVPIALKDDNVEVRLSEVGEMTVGYFRFAKGTDLGPALVGLPGDMCQCPHWGYMLEGTLLMRTPSGGTTPTRPARRSTGPPGMPRKPCRTARTWTSLPRAPGGAAAHPERGRLIAVSAARRGRPMSRPPVKPPRDRAGVVGHRMRRRPRRDDRPGWRRPRPTRACDRPRCRSAEGGSYPTGRAPLAVVTRNRRGEYAARSVTTESASRSAVEGCGCSR